jgi:hypothetical protein
MVPDWAATPTDAPYANFGNPQSLNLYSYVKNNPTTVGDPDGHDGWDFVGGLANAFATDFFGGAARKDSSNKDYQAGQNVGDALAVDVGALEALGGAAVDVASIPLDAVGVGEVIQVGATAGAVQGATAVFTGGAHVVKAAINAKGSQGGPTAGQRFSDKDRAKDAGKNCVYCKQETTEKPGQPNSRETDHIHPASRNGNATSRNRALVSYCGVVELHFQQLASLCASSGQLVTQLHIFFNFTAFHSFGVRFPFDLLQVRQAAERKRLPTTA